MIETGGGAASWTSKLLRLVHPAQDAPLKKSRGTGWVGHAAALLVCLAPAVYALARDAMTSSLWLDEILYFHFERDPSSRGIEVGRPGSFLAERLGAFGFCDLQRGVHAVFDVLGLSVSRDPELYLRLPAFVYFALGVAVVYFLAVRSGADRLWATGIALAFASTPIFLFYAFEARVYSFSALLVACFVGLMASLAEGAPGWRVAVSAAVVAVLLPWAHPWNACLVGAMGILVPVAVWRAGWRRGGRIAAILVPGAAFVLLQALWFVSLRTPGRSGIPLFDPQPLATVFWSTVNGPFLSLLTGEPELVLAILFVIALVRGRGRLGWWAAASVALALALSVAVMVRVGLGISPRHQAALYAGVFASLALARPSLAAKALLAVLVGINLVLLPRTVEKILSKGNARQIARVIQSGEKTRPAPVVVQHSFALGYPDPLLSFPLAFYLGPIPRAGGVRVLELPTHRDVTNLRVDRDYFVNPGRSLPEFQRSPDSEWIAFLRSLPEGAVWLATPPSTPANVSQARTYEAALRAAGFSRVSGIPTDFAGYPTTRLALWVRRGRGIP